jgi:uncharacterized membrane protein
MGKSFWFAVLFLIALAFALSAFFYNQLPEQIPSRWDPAGEIAGYLPKNITLLIMPGIGLLVIGLFAILPKIDPLKENYAAFMPYFRGFILIFIIFILYLHTLTIAAGLGFTVKMNYWLMPAISALFLYIALLLKKARRNWFVGVRTPWTLSSDSVWQKTHALASKLFVLYAIVLFITGFFEFLFWPIIILLVILVIALFAYSYFEYAKEEKEKAKGETKPINRVNY